MASGLPHGSYLYGAETHVEMAARCALQGWVGSV